MLKVALNGRFSGTPQPTGTQTASYQLFDAVIRDPRDFEVVVFADPRFPGVEAWRAVTGTSLVEIPFQSWSRARAHVWEQVQFPILSGQAGCLVAHHPMTTNSAWHNGVKSVVTLHDLNYFYRPELYSRSFRMVYAFCATLGLRRADAVVTVSDFVLNLAREALHLAPEKSLRIYNGVKPIVPPSSRGVGKRNILCVGSLQPHKNLPRLIHAFHQARKAFPDLELHVVGRPQARFSAQAELGDLLSSEGVKILGYLPEEELARAYAEATVFCYPSLEEGFGLPVVEAMSVGTPTVTSDCSCLPEVAGPDAVLVDPKSVEAIAHGLLRVLHWSDDERTEVSARIKAWAARYAWKTAAQEYGNLYRKLGGKY